MKLLTKFQTGSVIQEDEPVPLQEDVSESPHNFVVESPPTIDFATEFVPATSEITSDQSVHEVHR